MQKNYNEYILGKKHLKLTAFTLLVTLTSIACFGLIGYAIDTTYDTNGLAIVIGIVTSYPITQIILNKVIRKI